MKKAIAAVLVLGLASPVMAAVGIEVGSNWYKVNYTDRVGDHLMGQGQSMLVYWGLDTDLTLGAYTENLVMSTNYGSSYSWEMAAIQVAKGIVKNVNFGLNLGTGYFDWISGPIVVTDVFASVVILSGASDRVSGTVKATVAGRFCREVYSGNDYDFNGLVVGLAIGLGF